MHFIFESVFAFPCCAHAFLRSSNENTTIYLHRELTDLHNIFFSGNHTSTFSVFKVRFILALSFFKVVLYSMCISLCSLVIASKFNVGYSCDNNIPGISVQSCQFLLGFSKTEMQSHGHEEKKLTRFYYKNQV